MVQANKSSDVWGGNALNLDGSRVIDRRVYVDEDILAAEQELIFAKTWQWVAHETELPNFGDYITVEIAGRPIVVVRGENGKINAFYNTCTHRGAIIAEKRKGNCKGSFTCLYHAWVFDTEGKLVSAPLPEAYGDSLKKACYDSPSIRVESFANSVFVNLDPAAESLEDFLGEAKPWLEIASANYEALGRVRWTIDANWKLWHENFRDNYHPMFAHQFLGANYQGVDIQGRNIALGNGHSAMPFPPQGNSEPFAKMVERLTKREFKRVNRFNASDEDRTMILAFFPNLDFQSGTGALAHSVTQTARPLGVDKCVVELTYYGIKGESDEARAQKLTNGLAIQTAAGKVSGDDVEAARRCSVGFGTINAVRWSNMDRGQKSGNEGDKNDEYSLREFYAEYKRLLGDRLKD